MRVFVSGHLKISETEFEQHYTDVLRELVCSGHSFVVGDARGVDSMAQSFLKNLGANVTVFHMFEKPRFNAGFPTNGGYRSDDDRDAAMTAASDIDVAWVRPGREKSGTARNLERRAKQNACG